MRTHHDQCGKISYGLCGTKQWGEQRNGGNPDARHRLDTVAKDRRTLMDSRSQTYHLLSILLLPPQFPSAYRADLLALFPWTDRYNVRLHKPPQVSLCSILPTLALIRVRSQLIIVLRILPRLPRKLL